MIATLALPSEVGSALSLQEQAHTWEKTKLSANQSEGWHRLIASAIEQAAHVKMAWSLCTTESEVWDLDWYVQRMRALEFLGSTVADTLSRIEKMNARLSDANSELYDPSQNAVIDAHRRAVGEIVSKARENLARITRPGPPVNYESIERSRQAFDIGQGENLEEIIARVTAGGEIVRE